MSKKETMKTETLQAVKITGVFPGRRLRCTGVFPAFALLNGPFPGLTVSHDELTEIVSSGDVTAENIGAVLAAHREVFAGSEFPDGTEAPDSVVVEVVDFDAQDALDDEVSFDQGRLSLFFTPTLSL